MYYQIKTIVVIKNNKIAEHEIECHYMMKVTMICMILYTTIFAVVYVLAQNEEDIADSEAEAGEEEVDEGIIVETPLGFLKGIEYDNAVNGSFVAFFGIPFAKPPIGPLRFMAPIPAEPWEGVLDATEEKEGCVSYSMHSLGQSGVEDCLTLDVYLPGYPEDFIDSPLSILVNFHSGAFHTGSIQMESGSPDFLMLHKIILVNVHYRLNVFGFLSFQDEVVPGNAGMKDQMLALKWVRSNIASFGGDPDKVTIMGTSAGAASVHLHILSPLSRGLFHRAILDSGTAIAPWVLSRYPAQDAAVLADMYNCSRDSSRAVLACLQAINTEDLLKEQYNAVPLERKHLEQVIFTPCVEPRISNAFLVEDPFEILSQGNFADVPVIGGIAESELSILESVLSLNLIPEKFRRKMLSVLSNFKEVYPKFKPFVGTRKMAIEIEKFYYGNSSANLKNLHEFAKLTRDLAFLIPLWDSTTLHLRRKKMPIFTYMFTHDSNYSYVRQRVSFAPPKGVNHGDLMYGHVLYIENNGVDADQPAFQTAMKVTKMFADFIRMGNPTPDDSLGIKWLPNTLENRYYLNIGEELKLEKDMEHDTVQFWNQAREKEGFVL